jgi:hypothetical protein
MSAIERLVLWLHVAFVIFTIGPVTIAIMSSPRAIRTRNVVVLEHLLVMTRIFGTASLGVLVFGIILGQQQKDLSKAWLTVSLTRCSWSPWCCWCSSCATSGGPSSR